MSAQLPEFFISVGVTALVYALYTIIISKAGRKNIAKFDNQIEKIASIVSSSKIENEDVVIPNQTANLEESIKTIQQNFLQLKSEVKNTKNTWSLVEGLIENYHKQALTQAGFQFWFSAIAAVFGLGFITMSLFFAESTNAYEKVVGSLPGVMINVIAVLFFKQAEQTRQRATDLYDRLRTDKEREVAIKLIEDIDDQNLKSIARAQLALKIGGVDVTLQDLSNIVSEPSK